MSTPTRFVGGVQADFFLGLGMGDGNIFGNTWYVNGATGGGSDSNPYNTGNTPATAFASIGAAIAAAAAGDTIIIAPATYTVTSAIVPKARQIFKAAVVNPRCPSVIITGNIADVVQIDVDNTKWVGIEFRAAGNTADNLVDVADAAAVTGLEFWFCTFNGADKTSVIGINANDATFALVGLFMRGCLFRDLTGTMINIGALGFAYSDIESCQFATDVDSGIGIALADTTAFATGKGYRICNNDWTGFDATGDEVGISIAGTENVTGAGIIRTNFFAYNGSSSAAITQDKLSKSEINNYVGDAATGGTLLDPGT
jgi:hypothetical protein